MAVVWVSFRIGDVTIHGKSYDDRLKALTNVFYSAGTMWWDQTTSFIVVDTTQAASTLATKARAAMAPSVDMALIRAMDNKEAYIVGNNSDADIHTLIPYLKKV